MLYSGGSEQEHGSSRSYTSHKGEDDGSQLLDVAAYLERREGEKPPGVYALYDSGRTLQYVGYSRNIVLAVKERLIRLGSERCAFVRPMLFANRAMASRAALERQAAAWLEEAGTVPPGNGPEQQLWDGAAATANGDSSGSDVVRMAAMSAAERTEYEEKKLKMMRAMGGKLPDSEAGGDDTDLVSRRAQLIASMERDDWSAIIDGQTESTLGSSTSNGGGGGRGASGSSSYDVAPAAGLAAALAAAPSSAAPSTAVVSPFAQPNVHRSIGSDGPERERPAMTPSSVDAALDEVRPYLIADGGNVEVVDVTPSGVVLLRLEGACGTCPSSSATLRMGIERQLQAVFGEQLVDVVQVDKIDTSASVASVDEHLNLVRPALGGMGGAVEVASVGGGVAVLRYRGPPPLGKGVVAAVKDKFPDVKDVILKEFE